MSKKLKIGIVGCGAIGASLAKFITRDMSDEARLVFIYDIDILKAKNLVRVILKKENLIAMNLEELIKKSDLVIEAASCASSWEIAKKAVLKRCDIMIMSVGGVVSHLDQLKSLANRHNANVFIPSGAISGIDSLKAARIGKIKKVILITRKNPLAFKGVKYIEDRAIKLNKIKKDKVLFLGKAKDAVRYFPQNINVAGILSLAGIGQEKTLVKIIASPAIKKNIHQIQIESGAGKITTRTENVIHPDNPKTSFLAVLSAMATLKQIFEPIKIGT